MTTLLSNQQKDIELWKLARKRAGFKSHRISYLIINAFLWALWAFSGNGFNDHSSFPWPLFTTIGWGIGLAFHFAGTYIIIENNMAEREYQKLIKKKL